MSASLLDVVALSARYAGGVRAVDEATFSLGPARTLALVGESGSGKSTLASAILRLGGERVALSGRVLFEGHDVLSLDRDALRAIRGGRIGMVFQDASSALDPSWRVGEQIAEAIRAHASRSRAQIADRVEALLRSVGIADPVARARAYPHELSGGMKQRVMIAIALASDPVLLIADEPTTALDVTIQAQILALLRGLQRERGLSILLVTHDLGLVAETADDVCVLYAGSIVESGPVAEVLHSPMHPYTAGLLQSSPLPGATRERLSEIPGVVPDLRALPAGCRFADRCARVEPGCRADRPPLVTIGRRAHRCFLPLVPA